MTPQSKSTLPKHYDTRLDTFRVQNRIDHVEWARRADMSRTQFAKARQGHPMTTATFARLVRAATSILRRPVRASELWDFGDDESAGLRTAQRELTANKSRKSYGTRFDTILLREGVTPAELARAARLTRQTIRKLRAEIGFTSVRTVADVIRALRSMGCDVRAAEMFDLGENFDAEARNAQQAEER